MKKQAKTLAILLAVLIGMATFSSLAFAENTALPPDKGNLHIHKFLMPDLALAGDPNDGTTTNDIPASAEPIAGIVFKVYKINASFDPHTSTAPLDETAFVLDNYDNPTQLTTSDNNVFTLAMPRPVATVTTNASGVAVANDLDQGYYLVVEQIDDANRDAIASVVFPFIVAVPMTNKNGDGWLKDVHCYPKNGDISIEKAVDRNAVKLGEEVKWSVTVSVPADIVSYQQFDITDQLDTALDYKADSLVVYGLMTADGAGTEIAQTGNRYNVVVDSTNKLTLSFTQTGRNVLADYKFIRVEFVTTVNQNILDRVDYTVVNTAKVEFKNKFDSVSRERESNEVAIHSAAIQLDKVDAHTNNPLAGAEFQIASSEANARNGRFIKKITEAGKVRLVDYGEPGWDTASPWIETSAATTGIVLFESLKAYTGMKDAPTFLSYWIVETKAPGDYNLLANPIMVTFSAQNLGTDNLVCGITVKNTNKFTLPQTGGAGTILFTAGGMTLIAIAAFLLIMNARKKKKMEQY